MDKNKASLFLDWDYPDKGLYRNSNMFILGTPGVGEKVYGKKVYKSNQDSNNSVTDLDKIKNQSN